MKRERIQVAETIATVIVEESYIPKAIHAVHEARTQIMDYIEQDPTFEGSFEPVPVSNKAPQIVKSMAKAAAIAEVGPMAAVAGAIAQFVVEELVVLGAEHIIFDNGGDIAMHLERPVIAGIYAGPASISDLGLRITELGEVIGLCASSGTVGHSFSYGLSDASVVYSRDVTLSDAIATRLANLIISKDPDVIISAMRAVMVKGVDGAMAIIGDMIGTSGRLPEVVRANVDYDLISKGRVVCN